MTRINVVPVETLLDEHLIAEWRELPRIPNELIKHPKRFKLEDIPAQYTLNTGHVKFFRNKLLYLINRHKTLCQEMDNRGIKRDPAVCVDETLFTPVMIMFGMNDYAPTREAVTINVERIVERFNLRKKAYHYKKDKINCGSTFGSYVDGVLTNGKFIY
jgi:deoxyribonuclease (pyrimidine dimer)